MASTQSRYDHAEALQRNQPPVVKLAYLVNELRKWAELNPELRILHSEFAGLLREMQEKSDEQGRTQERAEDTSG